MTAYLLPCSCGRKTTIEPRQAGEVVACACGASLTVPTMLEMAALERDETESDIPATRNPWGARQRLILLGIVIGLLAGVPAICLFFTQPTLPKRDLDPQRLRRQVEALNAVQSWQLYRNLRQQGPQWEPLPQEAAHAKALLQHRIYAGTLALIACVGIVLIVVASTMTNRKRAP